MTTQKPVYFALADDAAYLAGQICGEPFYRVEAHTTADRHARLLNGEAVPLTSVYLPAWSKLTLTTTTLPPPGQAINYLLAQHMTGEMVSALLLPGHRWVWNSAVVPVIAERATLCYPVRGQWAENSPPAAEVDAGGELVGEIYSAVEARLIRPRTAESPAATESPAAESPAAESPAAESPAAESPAAESPAATESAKSAAKSPAESLATTESG